MKLNGKAGIFCLLPTNIIKISSEGFVLHSFLSQVISLEFRIELRSPSPSLEIR
jgi:hypothetical protein